MYIFTVLSLGFSFVRFGLFLPLLLPLFRLVDSCGHQRPLFMSRLSSRQHHYHRYLLYMLLYRVRACGSLVIVDHCGVFVVCVTCLWFTCSVLVVCSGTRSWCVQRARGVFTLWFVRARDVCDVLVVCWWQLTNNRVNGITNAFTEPKIHQRSTLGVQGT